MLTGINSPTAIMLLFFKNSPLNHHLRKIPNFRALLSLYPRSSLVFFILFLQLIILTSFYSNFSFKSLSRIQNSKPSLNPNPNPNTNSNPSPIPKPNLSPNPNSSLIIKHKKKQCRLGKFYVYELPYELNLVFIDNCDTISPWGSQCGHLSNNGLGRKATGIEQVIPARFTDSWYWTDQFSLEVLFHNRMLHHECRTNDPESAVAYYIPFYAGLAVGKYLWGNLNFEERDQHCNMMLKWVQSQFPYYNRSNGLDHFLAMGRITWDFRRNSNVTDWGSRCIYQEPMTKITRLLIERKHQDFYDVGVPYPTGFHPNNDSDVILWQDYVRSRDRHSLFCFVGGPRATIKNDFRGILLNQCKGSGGLCKTLDCARSKCTNGTSKVLETFLDSNFCLQPRGDSYTRRSVFDCMIAGSIPVFFWNRTAYAQYPWYLTGEPKSYSVFIHRNEVKNGTSIQKVLESYSKDEVKKMREKVVQFIPHLIYAKPNEGLETIRDAVDVAVDKVMKRIESMKIKRMKQVNVTISNDNLN